jgi:hypothetical protein
LVVEPINERDKVVEELMGGKAVGEMDSREEDKGELKGEHLFLGDILVYGKVRKFGEEEGEGRKEQFGLQFCLRTLTGAPLLLGILGLGTRKP